jgi:uncharacterized membrane protein
MSSLGLFSPPTHYKGKFIDFSYNERTQVTEQEWETLNKALQDNKFQGLTQEQLAAVKDLVAQRQLAGNFESRADKKAYQKQGEARMFQLESILAGAKGKTITLAKDAQHAIKHAIKQVHKKSKTVTTLTDCMIWFFAFGLIGLGMQITKKAIFQAGGWPLVIGIISGVTKATLSFFVVLWLVKDVVLK